MKKTLIFLTIILLSLSARAEGMWSGYYIHFGIKTTDMQDIYGYLFVSRYDLNIDSYTQSI